MSISSFQPTWFCKTLFIILITLLIILIALRFLPRTLGMAGTKIGRRCCPMLLLLRLLSQVIASAASSVIPVFNYHPTSINDLAEGMNQTVGLRIDVNEEFFQQQQKLDGPYNLQISTFHEEIASIGDESRQFLKKDFAFNNMTRYYSLETTFTIHGHFLGKTGVKARLVLANWDEGPSTRIADDTFNTMEIAVRRSDDSVFLTKIFVGSLVVVISIANILMGCELDLSVVTEVLKRPIGPAIGFFTQFIVMPLLAYAISHTVFTPSGLHSFALGLFVTGCSPGGGASNFWTLLLDGNMNLSVTMTFISTLASLVMMPLWLSLLGHEFLRGFGSTARIKVPYSKILSSLFSLVVPLLIGIAIAKWKPNWAAKGRKVLRPFIIFVLIFVIVFGCLTNTYMWQLMTGKALLGGLLLPWCGFMCGCFIAIGLGRTPYDVTAIAIETGIQNTGIAILLLKWSFPEPDADISALIPVIVACFTPGPLMLGAAVHLTIKKLKKKKEEASIGQEMTTKLAASKKDGEVESNVGASTIAIAYFVKNRIDQSQQFLH
ncbi:unnamed protein product, partial [Mesorhabditis belari]|uniref:Uncharacterized protein n=1 Tax=Mesorhabditis belari TaxID=2138241 RepID=A0AAF3EHE5_9BILA